MPAFPAHATGLADAFRENDDSLVAVDPQVTPRWASVLARATREDTAAAPAGCGAKDARPTCAFGAWQRQLRKLQRHSPTLQLALVHQRVNALPYASDSGNWGQADYWETPREMFARGGDCEGYALTKYFGLRALGFADRAMRIAILWDRIDREEHAVLLVRSGETVWLLDNKFAKPQPAATHDGRYQLIYAVNAGGVSIAPGQLLGSGASGGGARLIDGGRRLAMRVEPRRHSDRERYNPIPFSQRSAAALSALTASPRVAVAGLPAGAAPALRGAVNVENRRPEPSKHRYIQSLAASGDAGETSLREPASTPPIVRIAAARLPAAHRPRLPAPTARD